MTWTRWGCWAAPSGSPHPLDIMAIYAIYQTMD